MQFFLNYMSGSRLRVFHEMAVPEATEPNNFINYLFVILL